MTAGRNRRNDCASQSQPAEGRVYDLDQRDGVEASRDWSPAVVEVDDRKKERGLR